MVPGHQKSEPFQADQGKGHKSSGARDFLAGRSPLRGEGGGYPLSGIFPLLGFLNTSLSIWGASICYLGTFPSVLNALFCALRDFFAV